MYALKQTVAPTIEPITLAEAKNHLRVDTNNDDVYIETLIKAVRRYTEDTTSLAFLTQTWTLKLDCFPDVIEIYRTPVQSVSSITYVDVSGDTQTLPTSDYYVDTDSMLPRIMPAYGEVFPSVFPRPLPVTVTFIAGNTTAALVPEQFKQALLLLLGHYYENRELLITGTFVQSVPMAYDFLMNPYKLPRF